MKDQLPCEGGATKNDNGAGSRTSTDFVFACFTILQTTKVGVDVAVEFGTSGRLDDEALLFGTFTVT